MAVPTRVSDGPRFDGMARLRRELVDPRTFGRIGYLLIAGVLGTIEFVVLVTAISSE